MPDGRQPAPGGWNRFVFEVDDIQGLVAKLKSEGKAVLLVSSGAIALGRRERAA